MAARAEFWNNLKVDLGKTPVAVFDFSEREGETDLAVIGRPPTAREIYDLQTQGGGIFVAYLPQQFFDRLGLKPMAEFVSETPSLPPIYRALVTQQDKNIAPRFVTWLDLQEHKYGSKSPVETAQVCRALFEVLNKSPKMIDDELNDVFWRTFSLDGNVPLISGSPRLLQDRRGHTELLLTIAKELGLPQIAFTVETADRETFGSMRYDKARALAQKQGIPLVTGKQIMEYSAQI
ncbi:MAG TPA: 3,4-dihydroxy-2-butanone-4-phosphate synthase [Patescibacteria group bacterium]|nr:3,4-dihydroxy-2-butanone-4-phosphate synthase [Patescibacteria group bacterium]